MTDFHPVSTERHANKGWRRYTNYGFAAQEAVAPLVGSELPKAVLSLPIAFIESDSQFIPVAVLGIQPGQNLFVAADGHWIQGYIPATFRCYPFRLARTEAEEHILCFDQDSQLMTDGEGEAFFDAEGKPSAAIQSIMQFLTSLESHRIATVAACEALRTCQLFVPWRINVEGDGGVRELTGIFKIDESRLAALDGDALKSLQQSGALALLYCQLLSMQHLPLLGKLAQAHAQLQARTAAPPAVSLTSSGELDLEFLNKGGTIQFGNL